MLPVSFLPKLQTRTANIRNICILAHVDHGKTTLADCLISSNGIISERSAGLVRYMDSRQDEQERLITMKSSSISLVYQEKNPRKVDPANGPIFLINLIDSPGHVDFTSEVSTAVRVTDGAIVVVDLIDGVGVQTKTVLRQMWKEKLKPVLLLNKVDALILQRKMTPLRAYLHIQKILEQVNAILASFFKQERYTQSSAELESSSASSTAASSTQCSDAASNEEEELNVVGDEDNRVKSLADWSVDIPDDLMENYFDPSRENVAFSSALDRWAFRLSDFARMYAERLKLKPLLLRRALWGNFYVKSRKNPTSSEVENFITRQPPTAKSLPLFAELALKPIWDVYRATVVNFNQDRLATIVETLGVKVLPRDLTPGCDTRNLVRSIMSQWRPLAPAVLGMVAEHLPNPIVSQANRIPSIFRSLHKDLPIAPELQAEHDRLTDAMVRCDKTTNDVVVFIAKVFDAAPDDKDVHVTNMVALARIFCGTLRKGAKLHVLGPKFDPQIDPQLFRADLTVDQLYLLMGRDVSPLDEIPAGNVFGIGNIEDHVLKTATLSTSPMCCTFSDMPLLTMPIVRVAIEPENPIQRPLLLQGLRLLNQSDPCVNVMLRSSGECLIVAAGEVHLQRCLTDLRKSFCPNVPIRVSEPLVSFRETLLKGRSRLAKQLGQGLSAWVQTPDKTAAILLTAEPLPPAILAFLTDNEPRLKLAFGSGAKPTDEDMGALHDDLERVFAEVPDRRWAARFDQLWALGPRRIGPNVLLNAIPGYIHSRLWVFQDVNKKEKRGGLASSTEEQEDGPAWPSNFNANDEGEEQEEDAEPECREAAPDPDERSLASIEESIINGFQMSCAAGPLCAEPIQGVCFIINAVLFGPEAAKIIAKPVPHSSAASASESSASASSAASSSASSSSGAGIQESEQSIEPSETTGTAISTAEKHYYGPFSGQVISVVKEGCAQVFLLHSVRLVEPMYMCYLEVSQEGLGAVYVVLGKRRAVIRREEMREGSDVWTIEALLPVAESFGFADELLTWARGAVSIPSLVFSQWSVLPEDPFFVPQTEEELEEFGTNYKYLKNKAGELIMATRRRKGLKIEEKLVESGEKQRTLAKKK